MVTTPSARSQRDNLNIGIFLAGRQYGEELEPIFRNALGYNPNGPHPTNDWEIHDGRFRSAQAAGRQSFRNRRPGYFTFNAMPFGGTQLYKVTWYVWLNPQTNASQTVPIPSVDLRQMRRTRDKDLDTRIATARSIRTASNIEDQRNAIARSDYQELKAIQSRMLEDDSLGEILSGLHGLPYADIEDILPQLPDATFAAVKWDFQRTAKKINQLQHKLRQEHTKISDQLMSWVMLKTGLPNNAPQLALQDAVNRMAALGGP